MRFRPFGVGFVGFGGFAQNTFAHGWAGAKGAAEPPTGAWVDCCMLVPHPAIAAAIASDRNAVRIRMSWLLG